MLVPSVWRWPEPRAWPRVRKSNRGPPVSFNRDIRPILSNNCFACHGPDATKRETEFHFDTREGAFAEDGIIVPGSAAGSMLVKRITNPDPEKRMPPPDSGHALTARQIELLRRWIDEGAKWDTHWAYTRASTPGAARRRQGRSGRAIRSIGSSSRGSNAKA